MAKYKDLKIDGSILDKAQLLKSGAYYESDFFPKLDLGMNPFLIKDTPCGWCRWHKRFSFIRPANNSIGWEFVEDFDVDKLKVKSSDVPKVSLRELFMEYHRLRDLQDKETPVGTAPETLGLTDLMKYLQYRYQQPSTLRVHISKSNDKFVDIYNAQKEGRAPKKYKNGWWSKDFPNEDLTPAAQKKIGYRSKLMKGLVLHPDLRKPTMKDTNDNFSKEDESFVLDFINLK